MAGIAWVQLLTCLLHILVLLFSIPTFLHSFTTLSNIFEFLQLLHQRPAMTSLPASNSGLSKCQYSHTAFYVYSLACSVSRRCLLAKELNSLLILTNCEIYTPISWFITTCV